MGYYGSPDVATLIARVQETLTRESVDVSGYDTAMVTNAMNRAARRICDQIVRLNRRELVYTKTYTVAAADAAIDLPDGSEASYPRVRRIIDIVRTDRGTPEPLQIIGGNEAEEHAGRYDLIYENLTLRWANYGGAPEAMTVVMRYIAALPEATTDTLTATPFSMLSPEWIDCIVDLAAAELLPTAAAALKGALEARVAGRIGELTPIEVNKIRTGPKHIRRDR